MKSKSSERRVNMEGIFEIKQTNIYLLDSDLQLKKKLTFLAVNK